jgi:hypothetical protein
MLGHSLASDAIGPYETEEEKFERMLEAREAAQEKMKMKTAYEFGAKIAASSCSPCAMPNTPTNKKPYTSVSPAVTDASQHSEELGKPPVTETEHSEAKAKLPEEGVKAAAGNGKPCSCGCGDTVGTCKCGPDCKCRKPGGSCCKTTKEKSAALGLWDRIRAKKERGGKPAKPGDKDYPDSKSWKKVTAIGEKKSNYYAYEFGKKVAAINTVSGIPRYNPPKPEELMSRAIPGSPAATLSSPGMQGLLATPPAQRSIGAGSQPSSATASWEPNPPKTNTAGPPRPSATPAVTPDPGAVVNSVLGPVSAADRASADRDAQAAAAAQAAAKGGGGGVMDYLTNPYVLGGGLGAAGIAALLYHMSNQPKKKRRDEEDA